MKVKSNKPLIYDADRIGIKEAQIQIELTIEERDDINKIIRLKAVDSIINSSSEFIIFSKIYNKTYEEYDTQRAYFLSQDTSGLTGLELEDKLLQDALLHSLTIDPIYGAVGSDWERV